MTVISSSGERWTIFKGDSLIVLPGIERNISLIVTDPPYGIAYQSNFKTGGWNPIEGDETASMVGPILRESLRTLKADNQHLYIFGEFDISTLPRVSTGVTLVWDKGSLSMGDLDLPWSRNYEHIQFAKGRSTRETPSLMRKRKAAVLRVQHIVGSGSKRHPTEKPVPLLRDLIESSSKFDEVVLDPFMGSGSTGVAAVLEGRKFVGIEVESEYFDIAECRLREAEKAWSNQVRI